LRGAQLRKPSWRATLGEEVCQGIDGGRVEFGDEQLGQYHHGRVDVIREGADVVFLHGASPTEQLGVANQCVELSAAVGGGLQGAEHLVGDAAGGEEIRVHLVDGEHRGCDPGLV